MADRQIQQIRSIYGEILGIADHLPGGLVVKRSVTALYNSAIDELNTVSNSDYSRFKVTQDDHVREDIYRLDSVTPKMGSILARLEQEFGFSKPSRGEPQIPTTIVTVNNNNQISVSVTPIQQILQTITDDDLRAEVEELKEVIQGDKDKKKASRLLNSIQQKRWDVFIALLPLVLEHLGKSQSS